MNGIIEDIEDHSATLFLREHQVKGAPEGQNPALTMIDSVVGGSVAFYFSDCSWTVILGEIWNGPV